MGDAAHRVLAVPPHAVRAGSPRACDDRGPRAGRSSPDGADGPGRSRPPDAGRRPRGTRSDDPHPCRPGTAAGADPVRRHDPARCGRHGSPPSVRPPGPDHDGCPGPPGGVVRSSRGCPPARVTRGPAAYRWGRLAAVPARGLGTGVPGAAERRRRGRPFDAPRRGGGCGRRHHRGRRPACPVAGDAPHRRAAARRARPRSTCGLGGATDRAPQAGSPGPGARATATGHPPPSPRLRAAPARGRSRGAPSGTGGARPCASDPDLAGRDRSPRPRRRGHDRRPVGRGSHRGAPGDDPGSPRGLHRRGGPAEPDVRWGGWPPGHPGRRRGAGRGDPVRAHRRWACHGPRGVGIPVGGRQRLGDPRPPRTGGRPGAPRPPRPEPQIVPS